MQRFGLALVYAVGGYIVAAGIGYFLIQQFSANVHDRDLEAAMTSASWRDRSAPWWPS